MNPPDTREEGEEVMDLLTHMSPDEATKRRNEEAGHTLCEHCSGTGNELYSMYRSCRQCGGCGYTVYLGERPALVRRFILWRESRQRRRALRGPRDWKLETHWRLSRWFGIGQCFGAYEECHRCHAPASDIDYEVRRVRPFRIECLDAEMCREMRAEEEGH
jgi:hypothetical protein